MREHLENCRQCRKRLLEELYSLHRFVEGFHHPENEVRFRAMVAGAKFEDEAAEGVASRPVETRLYLDAGEEDEDEPALAAASRPARERAARHSSLDGDMILRRYPASAGVPGRLQLMADDPRLVAGAEIVIGGHAFCADANGTLTAEEALDAAADAQVIVVRSNPA